MDARPSSSRVVLSPIVGFIGNAGYVLVTVVGAMMILGGELLVGDLQAFTAICASSAIPSMKP